MPPSGYSQIQSEAIISFLRSCASALVEEARELELNPSQALRRECEDIRRSLSGNSHDPIASRVLALTESFYATLLKREPQSFSQFSAELESALSQARAAVLNIHIEPLEVERRRDSSALAATSPSD